MCYKNKEIAGYSNTHSGVTVVRRFRRKIKLHGTQTHRNIQETTNLVWKKIKLHSTQTRAATDPLVLRRKSYMVLKPGGWTTGKKIKLQGSQTTPPSEANKAMLWKERIQGTQTAVCEAVRAILVWKGIELCRVLKSLARRDQPSFESGKQLVGFSSWMCGVPDSPTGLRGIELQSSQTHVILYSTAF